MANELILGVEDNGKNRKLVRDVLTFKGYEQMPGRCTNPEALVTSPLTADFIHPEIGRAHV